MSSSDRGSGSTGIYQDLLHRTVNHNSSAFYVHAKADTTVLITHKACVALWISGTNPYNGTKDLRDKWKIDIADGVSSLKLVDMDKVPYIKTSIQLKKGNNKIECGLHWSILPPRDPWTKLVYIEQLPDGCRYGVSLDYPVHFIAMVNPKDNYYSIERQGYKTTTFFGRGNHRFKPVGRRATVILVGASVASRGNRPDSSESKIIGNGINFSSKGYATGLSTDNSKDFVQSFYGYHGSHKYNEQPERNFWADSFNFGDPAVPMMGTKEIILPGYISGGTQVSLFNARFNQENRLGANKQIMFESTNIWSIDYRPRRNVNNGRFGINVPMFGSATPTQFNTTGYGNQGGYSRNCSYNIHWGMGLSNPTRHSFVIPNHKPEYTISVGACPDAWVGKKWTVHGDFKLTCVNTSCFDGGVIIVEET